MLLAYLYTNACCLASDVSSSLSAVGEGGSGGAGAVGGGNRLPTFGEVLYPGCCSTGFGGSFFHGGKGRPGPGGGGSAAAAVCFGEGALPNGGRELREEDEVGGTGGGFSSLLLFFNQGGVGALLPPGLGGRNGLPPSGDVPRLPSLEEGDVDLSLLAEASSNFFLRSPSDSFLLNLLPDIGLVSGSTLFGGPRELLCIGLLTPCCGLGLSLCDISGPGLFSNCFIKFEIFAFFGAGGGGFGLLPLTPGRSLLLSWIDGLESGTGGAGGVRSAFTPVGPLLTFELGEPKLVFLISEGLVNFLSSSGDTAGFFGSKEVYNKLCHSKSP